MTLCLCWLYSTCLPAVVAATVLLLLLLLLIFQMSPGNGSPFALKLRSEEETVFFDQHSIPHKFPSLFDEPTVDLSVVVPAYNEQYRLRPMLDSCLEWLINVKKSTFEVIVVSDGSTDGTCDVVKEYVEKYGADKIRLLKLIKNRGKGGAVSLGMLSARGRNLLFADADGATRFEDLEKLYSALDKLTKKAVNNRNESDNPTELYGVVCGSRAHLEKEAKAQRSIFRTILMIAFHIHVWMFGVRSIKDTQCGFKLFTRSAAKILFKNLHVDRWAFDVEMLFIAEKLNMSLAEVAVNWTEIEGSKIVPVWSWLEMGFDVLAIWIRYRTGSWKIRL